MKRDGDNPIVSNDDMFDKDYHHGDSGFTDKKKFMEVHPEATPEIKFAPSPVPPATNANLN
jgi:hypothetical protein